MSEPLNPNIPNVRRLAPRFTPHTPFHHPHLDHNVPREDLHLVPPALFHSGRKLNWKLPRPAVANLHVKLELTNDPDKLLEEFNAKIPQINDVLGLWSEVKGASSTATGEARLRAQAHVAEDRDWPSAEEDKGTTFNLVSHLDTPGRADIIYLADAAEDSGEFPEDSSISTKLRNIDWLGFDGSYVHLEDAERKMAAVPTEQGSDLDEHSVKRRSTPSNLRTKEWEHGRSFPSLFSEPYSSEPDSENISREIGPYENFWKNHH